MLKALSVMTPEEKLDIRQKMDATNLTGVWTNFPGVSTAPKGKAKFAGRLYYYLLQQERDKRKSGQLRETAKQMRRRLLDEVEKRLVEVENDDLFVLLAV
jgi:hypothetical protein